MCGDAEVEAAEAIASQRIGTTLSGGKWGNLSISSADDDRSLLVTIGRSGTGRREKVCCGGHSAEPIVNPMDTCKTTADGRYSSITFAMTGLNNDR